MKHNQYKIIISFFIASLYSIAVTYARQTEPSILNDGNIFQFQIPAWILFPSLLVTIWITFKLSQHYYNKKINNIEEKYLYNTQIEKKKLQTQTQALEKFKHELEEREKRENQLKWHTEGMVKFNEIISQYKDNIKFLSRNLLNELIKYMEVEFGAIYILNDDDPNDVFIEMAAGYSLDKKRLKKTHFKIGEGNVGACFKEKERMYIQDLPDGYASIHSGLGDSSVNTSLLVPICYDNEILGVLELASFNSMETYRQEFLGKLCENLYSAFFSIRVSMKSESLISELKEQSTELKSREEEMRQNMEEMRATHEEFERKEEQYLKEIEELKSKAGQQQ